MTSRNAMIRPAIGAHAVWRRWLRYGGVILLLIGLGPLHAAGEPSVPFRIGFSKNNFRDVNENDAIAAVRVWAQEIARDRGISADPQPKIFQNVSEIAAALRNKTIDSIALTTDEYAMVSGLLAKDVIVIGVVSDSINVEYVLLVHRDSGIESLGDLRGGSLALLESWRTTLARPWLDILLARDALSPTPAFFGQVVSSAKIAKAVLPVFFRQMDACVVTRNGFETMVELNPQTGEQLKVLAVSPPMVPVAFCFRADFSSPLREKIMGEITRWHLFPASRQILTIFQTDRLEKHPVTRLDSALELLATHEALSDRTKGEGARKGLDRAPRGVK